MCTIIIIILRNLPATYSSKTKDLFNCHVLHHSKTAGAIGMYFPSSQIGRKQGNYLHLLGRMSTLGEISPAFVAYLTR